LQFHQQLAEAQKRLSDETNVLRKMEKEHMQLQRVMEEQNLSAAANAMQLNQVKNDLLQKVKASEDVVDIARFYLFIKPRLSSIHK
jgi:hypothetical protein